MPNSKWPDMKWVEYHLSTKEWKKATADVVGMLDQGLINAVEFDEIWQTIGAAILAGRKL